MRKLLAGTRAGIVAVALAAPATRTSASSRTSRGPRTTTNPKTLEFDEVVPGHGAVISLTRAISQQGYYVKRVVENLPRTGAHANRVNRSWDITGRIYDRVYPIHLVVDGEEIYDGDLRARAGTTRTTLTVQGAFANQEMEQRVEGVWEQLSDIVTEELRERARAQAKEG